MDSMNDEGRCEYGRFIRLFLTKMIFPNLCEKHFLARVRFQHYNSRITRATTIEPLF